MARANVFTSPGERDEEDPPGYRPAVVPIGKLAGGTALAVAVYELSENENVCPYHYEYEEEWLVVLDGTVILRGPHGEHELVAGDVVCFPPGPEGAHKVTNGGRQAARVLMFSSAQRPAVAVYPDSDKIGVWPGNADDDAILRRSDGQRDYWDGEGER